MAITKEMVLMGWNLVLCKISLVSQLEQQLEIVTKWNSHLPVIRIRSFQTGLYEWHRVGMLWKRLKLKQGKLQGIANICITALT